MSKPSLPIPRPLTLTRAAALAFVALLQEPRWTG